MLAGLLATLLTAAHADDRLAFAAWVDARDPVELPDTAEAYVDQTTVFEHVAGLLRAHPDVLVERYGTTAARQPLWAIHVPATDVARRDVLVFAALHPMEWIGTEVALAFLEDLLVERSPDVAVTVIPLANPDGRTRVERDLVDGRSTFRRGNAHGTDLNRDFDVHRDARSAWRRLLPRYHMASVRPMGAPETRALDALAARERYDRAASLHSFGGFHYFPWSGRWDRPPAWATFVDLGRAMQLAQGARAYKVRQLSRWGFFFRAQGTEIDHLYGRYGTRAFLIELTRSGISGRPQDWRTPFRWYNPRRPARHVAKGVAALRALVEAEVRPPPPGLPTLPDASEP